MYCSDRFFQFSTPAASRTGSAESRGRDITGLTQIWPDNSQADLPPPPFSSLLASSDVLPPRIEGGAPEISSNEDTGPVEGSPVVNAVIGAVHADNDPVTVLGKFCNEGNNIGEGVDLALLTLRSLEMLPGEGAVTAGPTMADLRYPRSWASLFGPPLSDQSTLF